MGCDGRAHQDGRKDRDLDGRVPAVDVVRGIGFGQTDLLAVAYGFVEGLAIFHQAENQVAGRVEDAFKAAQVGGRERAAKEREDRGPVHHGRLKQKAPAFGGGQLAEFGVAMRDWTFVGGDGVHAHLERRLQVGGSRLAVGVVDGGVLK